MTWPWVSRLAYDTLVEQLARERDEKRQLLDHVTRVSRREAGMPETPRAPRARITEVPDSVEDLIKGFQSEQIQEGLRQQVLMLLNSGLGEDAVLARLRQQLGGAA